MPSAGPQRVQLPSTVLPLNTITPFYRARLEVVDGVLRWEAPRVLLGLVPVGTRRVALPLASVVSARAGYGLFPVRLLAGLAAAAAVLLVGRWWAVPLLIALAAALLLLAPAAQLAVTTADGRTARLGICIRHRIDVDLVAAALNDLIGPGRPRRRGPDLPG